MYRKSHPREEGWRAQCAMQAGQAQHRQIWWWQGILRECWLFVPSKVCHQVQPCVRPELLQNVWLLPSQSLWEQGLHVGYFTLHLMSPLLPTELNPAAAAAWPSGSEQSMWRSPLYQEYSVYVVCFSRPHLCSSVYVHLARITAQ